jgi:hypothetical protein
MTQAFNIIVSIPYNVIMPRVVILAAIKLFHPELVDKMEGNRFKRNVLHSIITIVLLSGSMFVALKFTDLGLFYECMHGHFLLNIFLLLSRVVFALLVLQFLLMCVACGHFLTCSSFITCVMCMCANMPVLGGLSSICVSLIIPPILYLRLMPEGGYRWKCWVMIICGATGTIGCMVSLFSPQPS